MEKSDTQHPIPIAIGTDIKKIAIVGPESTGKSTMSDYLAKHYNTVWVPEFARDYCAALTAPPHLAG